MMSRSWHNKLVGNVDLSEAFHLSYCRDQGKGPAMSSVTETSVNDLVHELPTTEEIAATFDRLGLAGSGPSGYNYISAWNSVQPTHIFDVVRTSTSAPR